MSSSSEESSFDAPSHAVAGRRYMIQYARLGGPAVAVPVDLTLTATVGMFRDRVAQATGVPKGLQTFCSGGAPVALADDAVTLDAARLPQLLDLRRKTPADCVEEAAARVAALAGRVDACLAADASSALGDPRLLAELLTREQMALDAVDPGNDDALRARRREVIRAAQRSINLLESPTTA